jgi:hypothetical protein
MAAACCSPVIRRSRPGWLAAWRWAAARIGAQAGGQELVGLGHVVGRAVRAEHRGQVGAAGAGRQGQR